MLSEFPGLFSRDEFFELDVREVNFWFNQAEKRKLTRTLDMAFAFRLGRAAEDDWKKITADIRKAIDKKAWQDAENARVQSNWDELKMHRFG